jgi:uroporphyrinogen III methyltransferase/synthase
MTSSSFPLPSSSPPGFVSLVGAGPGDPGLITVKGLERIAEADVIVYDKLANESLLDHARPDAELIYMGKIGGGPQAGQDAINALLVEKGREGRRVVRLKGGDPYVFGRGGEEGEALRDAGIPFEVVPGVTSAIAVPSYAGIPITHRGLAASFAVVTGHEDPAKEASGINWEHLATGVDTLVFLMGVRTLPEIVQKLTENGRSADTPAAVIRMGTTPEQRTVTGTLRDIVARIEEAGITPPAITVVGEVVRMREALSWFEGRPLFGKRVLITRTRKQASVLARLLADEGAIPVELPAIEIEPVADRSELDAAIGRLAAGAYAWAVFTSANAVEEFFGAVESKGLDARAFGATRVCTIGPATAAALAEHGIRADLVPAQYIAEAVVEAMRRRLNVADGFSLPRGREGEPAPPRILIPRAEGARAELIEGLTALGAMVEEIPLYRAALPAEARPEALQMLRDGGIDIVTFTSSSTVRNLVEILGGSGPLTGERRPLIACIGPITAQTAEELGLPVDVVASEHTVEGLVVALREKGGG